MGKKNNQVKEFIVSLSMREKILIMLAVGFIVGFLIFLLLRYGFGIGNVVVEPIEKNVTEITFEKYKEDIKSSDKRLIYVDNTTLSTYKEFRPIVDSMLINRSIEVSFLDLSKVSEDELINFMNQTEVTKDSYMLPLLLVVENGKVLDSNQGVLSNVELQDFLSRNSISYKEETKNE